MSRPASQHLMKLIQSPQFAWFIGHVMTLVGSAMYLLSAITFHASTGAYRTALFGSFVSYGVIIYRKYFNLDPNVPKLNWNRMAMDENVHYFALALYWFFSSPLLVALVPYITFSALHTLGYIRMEVIPTLFPAEIKVAGSWQSKARAAIERWTLKANYTAAMQMVARVEVVGIMGRLLLGLFTLHIMPIFVYAQFLRFRYFLSDNTKQAFTELRMNLDRLLLPPTAHKDIPVVVTNIYKTLKDLITHYGAVRPQMHTPEQSE
ncbi:hypothetical protein EC973_001931 [Apophysomyces ossiformis]|uniref:Tetra-spanning protein 1 n=1 Tax=Apophysomyces ossiformis TaxID=679940 RepID=A0A8H7ETV7_9FUNG|nr:hypothetical protein EC973_001931 [Apophysomyces ossiformis]